MRFTCLDNLHELRGSPSACKDTNRNAECRRLTQIHAGSPQPFSTFAELHGPIIPSTLWDTSAVQRLADHLRSPVFAAKVGCV